MTWRHRWQPGRGFSSAPFIAGDRVRYHPDRGPPGFGLDGNGRPRAYTVTAVIDEGDIWRVDAAQAKAKGGRVPSLTTRWPKAQPDHCSIQRTDPTR